MIRFTKHIGYLILVLSIFSCNDSGKKTSKDAIVKKEYNYSIDTSGTTVSWTAYKFTNKIGVSGTFEAFEFETENKSGSIEALLEKSKIAINVSSINSKSEIRDAKLRDIFFKTFNTNTIEGEIIKAKSGKGALALKMNDITNNVDYNYIFKSDTLVLSTNLNLIEWKAKEALDTLNIACYDLHKGADGISKLWPDVAVEIKLPIVKN